MRRIPDKKKVHLILLLLYPLIAGFLSLQFDLNLLWSVALFLFAPSLHLSFLLKKAIKKTALFSLSTIVPAMIFVDYISHITKQWSIPKTMFPFRILGVVSLEGVIWAFLLGYFIVMFYEYFFDVQNDRKLWHRKMIYITGLFVSLLVVTLILIVLAPSLLEIPFFYFWWGTIIILIPTIIEMFRRPNLFGKFFLTGVYFFYLTFVYEIAALKLGWWSFPGTDFIGWVSVLGVRFPLEEFFFWLILTAMAILSYYEFFDDDER